MSELLRLEGVSKDFYGTVVLKDVSFSMEKGEILALVGENGAGKSTLMRILFGMPEIAETGGHGGALFIDGRQVNFSTPFDALDAGIGMVHQEFSLIPGFRADENIMLGREPVKHSILERIFGPSVALLKRDEMKKRAGRSLERLGVAIAPGTIVNEMPVAHKQFTEIAREIDRDNVKLLIMDEPTAVLTESEVGTLLASFKRLAAQGISIIFISHSLNEVVQIADRIVVLRDGRLIKNVKNENISVRDIASWMIGREMAGASGRRAARQFDNIILNVEHLWVDMPGERVKDVSFSVHRGEIFGIGGLAGSGKLGIPNGIMGICPAGGSVTFDDAVYTAFNPRLMQKDGIAFVSEDRRGVGLLLDESLEWNISFGAMQIDDKFLLKLFGGLVKLRDEKAMRSVAEQYIKQFEIKCTGSRQRAKELSGGNQQKICLAKAFALLPRLLFVSEPTRGIDVGVKKIVLDTLREINERDNLTIVMISSELSELRSLCDRIAIVSNGTLIDIVPPDTEPEEFALLMSGIKINNTDGGAS